jgi:hypothetical protein
VRKTSKASNSGFVQKRLPRFKDWAVRLPHGELAEKFAQLLAVALIDRKKSRDERRRLNGVMHDIGKLPKILSTIVEWDEERHNERSESGKKGTLNRPAILAKPKAKELWDDWQRGKTLHKSGAAFDRYVIDKFEEEITSTETVKRWRTKEWGPQARKEEIGTELAQSPTC